MCLLMASTVNGRAARLLGREMIKMRVGDQIGRDVCAYDMGCVGASRGMGEGKAGERTVV